MPAASASAPCSPWIDAEDVFTCTPLSDIPAEDQDAEAAENAAEAASRMLFIRTAHRYTGLCEAVVRPCRRSQAWSAPSWWQWDRAWGLCGCGARFPHDCGCPRGDELRLGRIPIVEITEVLIDGATLASSAYEIREDAFLARIDGDPWPCCQDLTAPTTEINTFQVSFTWGIEPPADGVLAAKRLAAELYLACVGSNKCQLPRRVREITRQGITVGFLDPQDFFAEGRLGIYEIDAFIEGERYEAAHSGTLIVSPDFTPSVRRLG